jgi:hypothetical protein
MSNKETADMANDRVINPGGQEEHIRASLPTGSPVSRPPDGPVPTGGANIKGNAGTPMSK